MLLGQARCLIALERPNDAMRPLGDAHDLFAQLGAGPAVAETRALLGESRVTPQQQSAVQGLLNEHTASTFPTLSSG